MLPELLISDLAGTVMREEGAVIVAYEQALTSHGIFFTRDDLHARRGANKRAVFQELAARACAPEEASARAEQALATFEATLHSEYMHGPVQEIDGATAALRSLRARGIRLALTSGFPRDLVAVLVDRLGWRDCFDITLSAEDAVVGRPAPFLIYRAMMALDVRAVRRVAVVGDTVLDLEAGSNARAEWIIGVLSGAHDLPTLGATPHTHLVPSIAAVPDLFVA
jgi:phosphonatase-like hydrolase